MAADEGLVDEVDDDARGRGAVGDDVHARAALEPVVAQPAAQHVVAAAAQQQIVAGAAEQVVGGVVSGQDVVVVRAAQVLDVEQRVALGLAAEARAAGEADVHAHARGVIEGGVRARAAVDVVGAVAAGDLVVVAAADKEIVAAAADQDVGARAAVEMLGRAAADQAILAAEGQDPRSVRHAAVERVGGQQQPLGPVIEVAAVAEHDLSGDGAGVDDGDIARRVRDDGRGVARDLAGVDQREVRSRAAERHGDVVGRVDQAVIDETGGAADGVQEDRLEPRQDLTGVDDAHFGGAIERDHPDAKVVRLDQPRIREPGEGGSGDVHRRRIRGRDRPGLSDRELEEAAVEIHRLERASCEDGAEDGRRTRPRRRDRTGDRRRERAVGCDEGELAIDQGHRGLGIQEQVDAGHGETPLSAVRTHRNRCARSRKTVRRRLRATRERRRSRARMRAEDRRPRARLAPARVIEELS